MATALSCELLACAAVPTASVTALQSCDSRSDGRSPPAVGVKQHFATSCAALPSSGLSHAAASRKHGISLSSCTANLMSVGWVAHGGHATASKRQTSMAAAAFDENQSASSGETEREVGEGEGGATAVAIEPSSSDEIGQLKSALVDSLYATDRGLRASSETRAEVVELITQLEALNPTPSPTESLPLLDGKWILVYTSFSEIFPLLAASNLPLIKVGEISQTIDASALTVQNLVTFISPLATTSFGASASFEVRSPKRVQIKFEESSIGTPQLTDFIDLPTEVALMGQKVDLSPLRSAIKPVQEAAQTVAKTIAERPPLKIPLRDGAASWLITTYLDSDLRISRGDGNSVFVLIKEGSPMLDLL